VHTASSGGRVRLMVVPSGGSAVSLRLVAQRQAQACARPSGVGDGRDRGSSDSELACQVAAELCYHSNTVSGSIPRMISLSDTDSDC
jgi:hypothetical protein